MRLNVRHSGRAKRWALLLLAALPLAGLVALLIRGRVEPPPIFVPRPVTFAPGLHMLGELSPSVAYVVETSEGLILVDTGLEEHHALLLKQFERLRLDIADVKVILVTHGHGDHYLGALRLQRLTGAKLYAGQGDSGVIREAGPREAVFSTFPMDHVHIHSTAVDVELVGGELIAMGEARIRVIATPGHTPGSVCYLLEHHGRTALFSGDTIMTLTGDLGTYSTYLAPRYRGDPRAYLATLRELEKLPVPDLLLPGHPRVDQQRISAAVSPQQWSSLLESGIANMEQLTARYAADGADFLDGIRKELLPGLHYLGDFSEKAVYCFSNQGSLLVFDAPEGPRFLTFLAQRLEDLGFDLARLSAVVVTSSGPDSVGGLAALLEKTGCPVIAREADWEAIRAACPAANIVPPDSAPGDGTWPPLQPILVEGFQRTLTVYELAWQGKRILVSGQAPLKLTRDRIPMLEQMHFNPGAFLQSLDRVQQVEPELWLPARPVHGQNANLYDGDWQEMLRQSRLYLGMSSR